MKTIQTYIKDRLHETYCVTCGRDIWEGEFVLYSTDHQYAFDSYSCVKRFVTVQERKQFGLGA